MSVLAVHAFRNVTLVPAATALPLASSRIVELRVSIDAVLIEISAPRSLGSVVTN